MENSPQRFISKADFENKLANDDLYAGYVVGEGYAYYLPQIYYQDLGDNNVSLTPQNFSLFPSECVVVWIQYLDDSPEMKMKSLGEDPTKWSDLWGSTKLQRFAAQEFARSHNGEIIDENKSNIHVEFGSSAQFTQYFRDDGTLIPQGGEIIAYEPNVVERFRGSWVGKSWVGKIVYGILDDAYITAQCFTSGYYNARHLTGEAAVGQQTVSAGISMLTLIAPIGSIGKTDRVLNAARFNSINKGFLNTSSQAGTQSLRRYNAGVREMEAFRRFYNWYSYPSGSIPYIIEPDSAR